MQFQNKNSSKTRKKQNTRNRSVKKKNENLTGSEKKNKKNNKIDTLQLQKQQPYYHIYLHITLDYFN